MGNEPENTGAGEGPVYRGEIVRIPGGPTEILRIEAVELDPIYWGFAGIVIELSYDNGLFTLYQFAAGTGNRLLFIQSTDEEKIRNLFDTELRAMRQLAELYERISTNVC